MGICLSVCLRLRLVSDGQLRHVDHWEGMENQGVDDREYGGVCADAEGKREYSEEGKEGCMSHASSAIAEISPQVDQPVSARCRFRRRRRLPTDPRTRHLFHAAKLRPHDARGGLIVFSGSQ